MPFVVTGVERTRIKTCIECMNDWFRGSVSGLIRIDHALQTKECSGCFVGFAAPSNRSNN